MRLSRLVVLVMSAVVVAWIASPAHPAAQSAPYYPTAGNWMHKSPADVGMDPAKLPMRSPS